MTRPLEELQRQAVVILLDRLFHSPLGLMPDDEVIIRKAAQLEGLTEEEIEAIAKPRTSEGQRVVRP